jgi:hypothetical protein
MHELNFPGSRQILVSETDIDPFICSQFAGSYQVSLEDQEDRQITIVANDSGNITRIYDDMSVPLCPLSNVDYINSRTGKLYSFEPSGGAISIIDVNNRQIHGRKVQQATGVSFDDREYDIDDPAKLVNLHIRDLLDLTGEVRRSIEIRPDKN